MMRTNSLKLITSGRAVAFLTLSLIFALVTAMTGCGAKSEKNGFNDGGSGNLDGTTGSASGGRGDGSTSLGDGGLNLGDGSGQTGVNLDVEPTALQTITIVMGKTSASVAYTAKVNGTPANATWTLDRGDLGSIGPAPLRRPPSHRRARPAGL